MNMWRLHTAATMSAFTPRGSSLTSIDVGIEQHSHATKVSLQLLTRITVRDAHRVVLALSEFLDVKTLQGTLGSERLEPDVRAAETEWPNRRDEVLWYASYRNHYKDPGGTTSS